MSDELMKKDGQKPFRPGAVAIGLAAKKKAAAEAAAALDKDAPLNIPPVQMPERIGITFDDSISMSSTIKDAHKGVEEFLRNCNPKKTAVTVYPMNDQPLKLCTTLPQLAQLVANIRATGGTPALETLLKMLNENNLTRGIIFTDGEFSDHLEADVVAKAREQKIPIDTVFIGNTGSYAIERLKRLAELTGGVFLHFIPGQSNFATAFKYLSPAFRAMLADRSFVSKVEKGEIK